MVVWVLNSGTVMASVLEFREMWWRAILRVAVLVRKLWVVMLGVRGWNSVAEMMECCL
jgi:hypothetical protein